MLPMIFGVPLLQMLVLVFAATFDMKKIDMVVVDKDLSETSRELIAKFDAVPFYHLDFAVPDETFGEEMLLSDDADVVLVIPPNMERNRRKFGSVGLCLFSTNHRQFQPKPVGRMERNPQIYRTGRNKNFRKLLVQHRT